MLAPEYTMERFLRSYVNRLGVFLFFDIHLRLMGLDLSGAHAI